MTSKTKIRGKITYDTHYGHVCTCTAFVDDVAYAPHTTYQNTVKCDRSSGTESGAFAYYCARCGATAWSGL